MTGKQQLRDLHESMLDPRVSHEEYIEHKTSGSTGIPVHVRRTQGEERRLNMLRWRMFLMQGMRPGDRMAIVKTTWESLPERFDRLQNLARRIRLVDSRVFDCFLPPAENFRELAAYQPHIMVGYPGALVKIALQRSGQEADQRSLRRIYCGGEYLAPHQRQLLEECFEVPVYDTYGITECNLAAWECSHTGFYHVCDDGILLEVCRDGVPAPPGETGEVVITPLHSRAMPLIRFQMNDLAVAGPSPCPCGSPFSTIQSLQGRIIDFLPLPDGRQLQPFQLLNQIVINAGDWVAEYQVIQQELDRFNIMIVPRRPVTDDEKARLNSALLEELGAGAQLQIETVSAIPSDDTGKLHFCRSLVKAD
jgi:phenylacetate-CoA ligase